MTDRIEKMEARLASMNARNDQLREQLATLEAGKATMLQRHRDAEQAVAQQLATLKATNAAELKSAEAEATAAKARREELKEDYADLYELVGQLKKSAE